MQFFPETDSIVNEVHFCDEIISSVEGDTDSTELISRIKRARKLMASCHGSLSSKLEVIKLMKEKTPFISLDIEDMLKDLKDRVKKSIKIIELARDNLISSYSNYISKIDLHRRKLRKGSDKLLNGFGIFAVIFVPFSTITGLFGMNCKVPYEDSNSFIPFYVITGLCFLLTIFLLCITLYVRRSSRKKQFNMKISSNRNEYEELEILDETERKIQIISAYDQPILVNDYDELKSMSEKMLKKSSIWIDIQNPNNNDLKYLMDNFGISKEIINDYINNTISEKIEIYSKFNYIITRYDVDETSLEKGRMLYLYHFPNFVISIHKNPIDYFDSIVKNVKNIFEFQKVKEDFDYNFDESENNEEIKEIISIPSECILFKILDGIVDYFVIISERLSHETDNCDDLISSLNIKEHSDLFIRINQTKKMITITHISTVPKLRLTQNLMRVKEYEKVKEHFQTMHFHVHKAIERIDHSRENLNSSQRNYITKLKLKGAESLEKQRKALNLISSITFLVAPSASFGELFRMNVLIPLQNIENLGPFFGVVTLIFLITTFLYLLSFIYYWFQKKND